jgi:cysteinyl-tRNA synthetase
MRGETPTLKLYNTLTREKEVFSPIDADNVRMYVCGPTVYDFAHIGNARPVIVFDVLYRLLRHMAGQGVWDEGKGRTKVTYVRNITDVDDKINARALRDFPGLPLNEAIRAVTEKTETQFLEDAAALGCLEPDHQPRATEFVLPRADGKADMAGMIQTLIDRGHAYEANGEILFDTSSMADYGRLSNRRLDEQQAGARVAVEAHKKNPGDFVLWKQSSETEPGWDATFTVEGRVTAIRGRPGWHIECSAMSAAYLGEIFDIHGGGLDLIFPHHENEIAQSRCANGTDRMANIWMHNGFLQVEGRKMSKSEGNFVTIHELLHTDKFGGRKWPGEVLRLAMLMTHYREPIDFSVRRLEEAQSVLDGWYNLAETYGWKPSASVPKDALDLLADDLDFSAVRVWLKKASRRITGAQFGETPLVPNPGLIGDFVAVAQLVGLLCDRASWLAWGGSIGSGAFDDEILESLVGMKAEDVIERIDARLSLIAEKNWTAADRIRDDLLAQGIQLKDSKDSTTGERVTTWEVKR